MNDIKITKDQALKIYKSLNEIKVCDEYYFLKRLTEEGWIVKDEIEEAIDKLYKHYDEYKPECLADRLSNIEKEIFQEHHILANKVIELLQKRIKELENGL